MEKLRKEAGKEDPVAMYQHNGMNVNADDNNIGKGVEKMKNMNREEYIDDAIATSVGAEPEAMFYVLERMESLTGMAKMSNHLELMPNDSDNDMIASAIGIDPVAMQQLLRKMDTMIVQSELDPAFSACIDDYVMGIDAKLEEYLSSKKWNQYIDLELSNEMGVVTDHFERDPAFSACIDDLIMGIDAQFKEHFLSLHREPKNADLNFVAPRSRKLKQHVA